MKNLFRLLIIGVCLFVNLQISIADKFRPPTDKEDIYNYMSNILVKDKDGCGDILDSDVVIYASRLYFERKYIDSIKILKKVHLDHDSIYWLWKNEIAICDNLVNLDKNNLSYVAFVEYVTKYGDYFRFDKELQRYFPTTKRLEESKLVYPKNEFLPEMEIYYLNLKRLKNLKLKK